MRKLVALLVLLALAGGAWYAFKTYGGVAGLSEMPVVADIAKALGVPMTPAVQQEEQAPRTVRWLLAHEPADVYARAIDAFAVELSRGSGGTLQLETVTPAELGLPSPVAHPQVIQLLQEGTVQMSSTYGVPNGNHDERFWVWQLPFLLEDYDHMEAAFASPAGERILADLSAEAPFRVLAYTLSGGFRIFASAEKEIDSVADLKGLRVATLGGPIVEAALIAAGAVPVPSRPDADSLDAENIDAVETTYARFAATIGTDTEYAKYIAETNHSLFFTTLVAGDAFYDSLTPAEQQALTNAARAAAAIERADAIALNNQTKVALEANGSTITIFTPAAREAFKKATEELYDTFASNFGDSVSAIRAAQQ